MRDTVGDSQSHPKWVRGTWGNERGGREGAFEAGVAERQSRRGINTGCAFQLATAFCSGVSGLSIKLPREGLCGGLISQKLLLRWVREAPRGRFCICRISFVFSLKWSSGQLWGSCRSAHHDRDESRALPPSDAERHQLSSFRLLWIKLLWTSLLLVFVPAYVFMSSRWMPSSRITETAKLVSRARYHFTTPPAAGVVQFLPIHVSSLHCHFFFFSHSVNKCAIISHCSFTFKTFYNFQQDWRTRYPDYLS